MKFLSNSEGFMKPSEGNVEDVVPPSNEEFIEDEETDSMVSEVPEIYKEVDELSSKELRDLEMATDESFTTFELFRKSVKALTLLMTDTNASSNIKAIKYQIEYIYADLNRLHDSIDQLRPLLDALNTSFNNEVVPEFKDFDNIEEVETSSDNRLFNYIQNANLSSMDSCIKAVKCEKVLEGRGYKVPSKFSPIKKLSLSSETPQGSKVAFMEDIRMFKSGDFDKIRVGKLNYDDNKGKIKFMSREGYEVIVNKEDVFLAEYEEDEKDKGSDRKKIGELIDEKIGETIDIVEGVHK